MPDNPPPVYKWNVTHSGGTVSFDVEAAYPVIEDSGHMVLKDAGHKPVFSAEPGLGCTFKRNGLAIDPAADNPPPGSGFWPCGCPVEGAKPPALPGNCPHGFPPTVRCHECSPVTAPGAQAEDDGAYIRRGTVARSEFREMRHGHGDDGDTAGARF